MSTPRIRMSGEETAICLFLAFFLPPASVGFADRAFTGAVCLNILLCFLGWIPDLRGERRLVPIYLSPVTILRAKFKVRVKVNPIQVRPDTRYASPCDLTVSFIRHRYSRTESE
uniref:Uncharacterized protein n=1 Tax=Kwoniella dejecticola CBS 10117 TaxID=1296121 RepID=A0A1A5ZTY2_9TREE|nr:uncharacterized protein I303_08630 [Kwoniella dejecticola CBS 10117]OBR81245.1 hypothetical protein I303_08630 [Kwoniella dejecticola CBS 10117]